MNEFKSSKHRFSLLYCQVIQAGIFHLKKWAKLEMDFPQSSVYGLPGRMEWRDHCVLSELFLYICASLLHLLPFSKFLFSLSFLSFPFFLSVLSFSFQHSFPFHLSPSFTFRSVLISFPCFSIFLFLFSLPFFYFPFCPSFPYLFVLFLFPF